MVDEMLSEAEVLKVEQLMGDEILMNHVIAGEVVRTVDAASSSEVQN